MPNTQHPACHNPTMIKGGEFLVREPESVFTPELIDADARLMAKTAAGFMAGGVLPLAGRLQAKEPGLLRYLVRKAASLGLMGTDLPEAHGRTGLCKSVSAPIAE